MIRHLLVASALLVATPTLAAGKAKPAKPAKLVQIGEIDGEADAKMSIVNVRLDHSPGWEAPFQFQDHGSFLQLNLPGAIVPEPGKFYDGSNPYLPKVAVFQVTPSEAGIRFFASKNAAKIKEALSAELLGNRIMITIDHLKLEALLAQAPAPIELVGPPSELAQSNPTAESVIAQTEVSTDIPAPAALFKGDAKTKAAAEAKLASGGIDLRGKLISVSIFSAAMLGLLGLTWLLRPYLRKKAAAKGLVSEPAFGMKTLASLPLAARQKISLIQVGDEKILLGVTPDNVTFLTAIGKSQPAQAPQAFAAPQSFTRMLETRAESLEMRQAPVLKKLPGNDPETLGAPKAETPTKAPVQEPVKASEPKAKLQGGRINLSVGEDGVKQVPTGKRSKDSAKSPASEDSGDGQKAIDDVTRMIREKLKTLRTI